jgi:hypothetical protein
MKTGLFSGRFDPPNLGHVLTIQRLLNDYHLLVVPILDYPERAGCTAEQAKLIFEYHFDSILTFAHNKIRFIINNEHFGKITHQELVFLIESNGLDWNETEYLSGNHDVLNHIYKFHMKTKFVDRVYIPGIDQYLFESTKIREEIRKTGNNLGEVYNIS